MRTVLKALAIGLAVLAGPAVAANPYAPALTVNDSVITNYDIDQRVLLLEALGASGDVRKLAVQQLTEDRVKVQAAQELQIELPEGAIEAGLEEFAAGRGLQIEDVLQVLQSRGIDRQTMDDFVESGLYWREVVNALFRARATPSEADLDAALEFNATTPTEMITLAEIALPYAERGQEETEALADELYRQISRGASFEAAARDFSRSDTAESGGVLPAMPAARLPAAFRSQVLLMNPGQVTRPVPIAGGVAIVKLVAINQVRPDPANTDPDDPEVREALRQQLFAERIASFGQGYLQELLGDALIVER
jgi:peptidyl-prolyl cis-trans isomerase SurA